MPRPCLHHGCPKLVDHGSYCPAHKRRDEGLTGARGTDGSWRKARAMRLAADRFMCQDCRAPATSVHHVNRDPTDHRPTNLVSLCDPCHRDRHEPAQKYQAESIGRVPATARNAAQRAKL